MHDVVSADAKQGKPTPGERERERAALHCAGKLRPTGTARYAKQMAIYVQPGCRPSRRNTPGKSRTYDAALRDELQMEVDAASGLFYKLLKPFGG